MNPHNYTHLIFQKALIIYNGEKTASSTNVVEKWLSAAVQLQQGIQIWPWVLELQIMARIQCCAWQQQCSLFSEESI
jgi:hypothetical protein